MSEILSDTQVKWSQFEKELYAVRQAVKAFSKVAPLRSIAVKSDNQAVVAFMKGGGSLFEKPVRVRQWVSDLLSLNFEIEWIKGADNLAADKLSRLIEEVLTTDVTESCENTSHGNELLCVMETRLGRKAKKEATQKIKTINRRKRADKTKDSRISGAQVEIARSVMKNEVTQNKARVENRQLGVGFDPIIERNKDLENTERREITSKTGNDSCEQVSSDWATASADNFVTEERESYVISKAHIGHPGVEGTRMNLRDVHFPKKEDKIRNHVKSCIVCTNKRPPKKVVLKGIRPQNVGEISCVDTCQIENIDGYFFVSMDLLSSFTVIHYAQTKHANNAIKSLQRLMTVCGIPKKILSDNGKEYMGLLNQYCEELHIERITTSVEHPNSNPAERRIGKFKEIVRSMINDKSECAFEEVELILNHQRSTVGGYSPKEIVTGISKGTIMTDFNSKFIDSSERRKIAQTILEIRDKRLQKLNRKRSEREFLKEN